MISCSLRINHANCAGFGNSALHGSYPWSQFSWIVSIPGRCDGLSRSVLHISICGAFCHPSAALLRSDYSIDQMYRIANIREVDADSHRMYHRDRAPAILHLCGILSYSIRCC